MGGKSSSSQSANTTNQFDQRQVNSFDDHSYTDASTFSASDSRQWNSTVSDSRAFTSNVTGADSAAINAQNTAFLIDANGRQTDAVKAISEMQSAGLSKLAGAFTDVSTVAGGNAERAWSHTVDAGAELFGKLADSVRASSDSSRVLAQSAISAFEPTANKQAETLKYGAIAGAAVLAILLMRKG